MKKSDMQKFVAFVNNTLMKVTVKGDDVLRVAAIMNECHDIFKKLEENHGQEE